MSRYDSSNNGSHECAACTEKWYEGYGFVYRCRECDFYLHMECTSSMPTFINSRLHPQHPLAFLDIHNNCSSCRACTMLLNYPFFRCMECRFNFHVHCLPGLPPTVKNKCHLHPLSLTHSPIKDYEGEGDDSEFLCDACEKERGLKETTYYCAECHYVAHVHCVISEVLPYLQTESLSLHDKLGNMMSDLSMDNADHVIAELDAEIATLETGVNELEVEEGALTRQLQAVSTQLETQKVMVDQLKERRAQHILSL